MKDLPAREILERNVMFSPFRPYGRGLTETVDVLQIKTVKRYLFINYELVS